MFHEFPKLVAPYTARLYFWHQLPYATPGFVTFLIGYFLAGLSVYSFATRRDKRHAFLPLALTCFGYGSLGLILALRAVVLDRADLLWLHRVGYAPVLLLSPGTFMLVGAITPRLRRVSALIVAVLWATTLLGFLGLALGRGFSGEGTQFSFGFYPRSSVWLAPWGLSSALVCPVYLARLFAARNDPTLASRPLLVGLALLPVVVLTNLPALLGVPLFPAGHFSFVPMLLVAWGIFSTDFLDLNSLLFQRSGLFYGLCAVLTLTFALLALGVATGLSPAHYMGLPSLLWPTIPLVSALGVFALGVYVAGTNPTEKLNQLAGAMMFVSGFYVVQGINRTLDIEPIISLRIDQLCYVAFALAPAIQPRVAIAAMGLATPRWMRFLDAGAVVCSVLALTPFMFRGYYVYEFGRVPASGLGLTLFSLVGALGTAGTFIAAFRASPRERTVRSARSALIVLACFTGGVLLVLSIPATRGVPFYSFGQLQILPAALLALAVVRYGALAVQEEIRRVSTQLTLLSFTVLPLVGALLYAGMGDDVPRRFRFFHLALLLSPLFLVMFVLLFVLSRPIAERLEDEKRRTEQILLSILPRDVVEELKMRGRVAPRAHPSVTILFADFVGFTRLATTVQPAALVAELDDYFSRFDAIMARYGLEKLKTIGDAYMAVGGLTRETRTHCIDACLAALAMKGEVDLLNGTKRERGGPLWEVRIGVHTGPVTSGVLGTAKLAFDIWGDAVNVAARMEAASEPGQVNISESTLHEVEGLFVTEARGRLDVKNRGRLAMFFLLGLRPQFTGTTSLDPNEAFAARYAETLRRSPHSPSAHPSPPSVEDPDSRVSDAGA